MVNGVSNYNLGYYNQKINKNKVNEGLNNSEYKNVSNIAFKANPAQMVKNAGTKTSIQFPKKILAFLVGVLGISTASKMSKTKSPDKLATYEAKYPELGKVLNDYDVWTDPRDIDHKTEHYSKEAKLIVYETFEKNPQEAYTLANKKIDDHNVAQFFPDT